MSVGPPLKVVPKGKLWWENYDKIFRKEGDAEVETIEKTETPPPDTTDAKDSE